MSGFDATNNPDLTCIQVDDAAYSTTNWTNIDATASFSTDCGNVTYTINATVNPANSGSISGTGVYNEGETVNLIATPNSNYSFINWTENGTAVSTDATYSFTAESDRTFVANFTIIDGISDLSESNSISIYPNPNSGKFTIGFENDYSGEVSIKVYTAIGIEIKDLNLNKSNGDFSYNIDLGNQPNGYYYIEIISSTEKVTKSIIIN
jgi:hypothetical protein